MATSDNVLRAGLTPKPRDVVNLVSSLTYQSSLGTKHTVKPSSFAPHTELYDPPVPEFAVLRTVLDAAGEESHRAVHGPSVAIVTRGSGSMKWSNDEMHAVEGTVTFIGAGCELKITSGQGGLEMYRAFVE